MPLPKIFVLKQFYRVEAFLLYVTDMVIKRFEKISGINLAIEHL